MNEDEKTPKNAGRVKKQLKEEGKDGERMRFGGRKAWY